MAVPDIVLLSLLGLLTLVGAFHGLVRMLYRLASTALSFVVFLFLAPPVAAAIQHLPLFDGPRAAIRDFLLEKANAVGSQTVLGAVTSLKLPEHLQSLLLARVPDSGASLASRIDPLAASLFLFALTAVVGLVLILVVMLVLGLATEVVEAALRRTRALNGVNHFAGAVLGLAEGLVLVFLVLGLIALAAGWFPDAAHLVESAPAVGFLYRLNPLLLLLK